MKVILFLSIFLVFALASIVSAQNIPPAPASDPYPIKIIKCLDSDEGMNYYSRGEITYEIVKWDAPQSHIPPENGQTDYCDESIGASQGNCNPTSKVLNEAYCEDGEINLVPKESEYPKKALKYKKYDCSSEGKV